MNLPMGRPGHWRVLPQLDARGVGELRPGHTRSTPCAACEAAAVAPPPPPAQLPAAERPTVPVPGDRALAPTLRPLAPVDLAPVRFEVEPTAVESAAPAAPTRPVWLERLALWELVLVALVDLGEGPHTEAEVVVAAWSLAPERFGLRGHEQYPDSRTVVSRLSGEKGLVGRRLARRGPTGCLTAHKDGRRYVAALRGGR